MERVEDRYDRLARQFLEQNTKGLVHKGVFDGNPDAYFIRHFVPCLADFLRREMPSEPGRRKPGRPKKVKADE